MGGISRRQSLKLLECAYDSGVRHFDVARSYGYGEAESVLGDFLQSKRDRVSVTTKVGIDPFIASSSYYRAARHLLRPLVRRFPGLSRGVRRVAAAPVRRVPLTPKVLTDSLHLSLKKLRVEKVDLLLLHECDLLAASSEELIARLDALVMAGDIGSYGVGASVLTTRSLISGKAAYPVFQFENNPIAKTGDIVTHARAIGSTAITHRSVGLILENCSKRLKDKNVRSHWSNILDFDAGDSCELARMFVRYSLTRNMFGPVIFSTRNEERIRSNCETSTSPLSEKMMKSLETMCELLSNTGD